MVLTYIVFYGGGLDEMPAWALKPRLRVVCLASQQGGPWVPLRWLRRVLTEWRVVVLQGQSWSAAMVRGYICKPPIERLNTTFLRKCTLYANYVPNRPRGSLLRDPNHSLRIEYALR